ncbi:hypothetical protein [Alkalihalophilus marmarensis]|nr:hypothetical protein [Alkalihalophilus marmarensis]
MGMNELFDHLAEVDRQLELLEQKRLQFQEEVELIDELLHIVK